MHQEAGYGGERSERQRFATGKASTRGASEPLARPQDVSTRPTAAGRDGDQDVSLTPRRPRIGRAALRHTSEARGVVSTIDFDGDYDATDAGLFDSLPQGFMVNPGRSATRVSQPFALLDARGLFQAPPEHEGSSFEDESLLPGSSIDRSDIYAAAHERPATLWLADRGRSVFQAAQCLVNDSSGIT